MKYFLFSCIIPAYNVEQYIADAIDSIINQSLPFEQNIQIVIVDDGSVDDTLAICKRYQQKYPENIVVISQSNSGVSAARNNALGYASGTYVNFFDSDDKWSSDAFECAANFFRANPTVNITTARHEFFGARNGEHPLSYKFDRDCIADIFTNHDFTQHSCNNAFIKRSLLPEAPFPENLTVSEDFLVIVKLLLKEKKFGCMSKPVYWYRKREEMGSAIDGSTMNVSWYTDTPKGCYCELFACSRQQFGEVLPYVQYAVMYDLQWRLRTKFVHPLTENQLEEYKHVIVELLQDIDDTIIAEQKSLPQSVMVHALALKHGKEYTTLRNEITAEKEGVCVPTDSPMCPDGKLVICSWKDQSDICIEFCEPTDKGLRIEFTLSGLLPAERIHFEIVAEGSYVEVPARPCYALKKSVFFEDNIYEPQVAEAYLPLSDKGPKSYAFNIVFDDRKISGVIKSGKFSGMSRGMFGYGYKDGYAFYIDGNKLAIRKPSKSWLYVRELKLEALILLHHFNRRDSLRFRFSAFRKRFKKSNERIWLISDRIPAAGDNGEAMFAYLAENPVAGVRPIFVIDKDSPDFERLNRVGEVVPYYSNEHKRLFLQAEWILSSSGDEPVINPFRDSRIWVRDLFQYKYCFLQHGVTHNDLSGWLNRYKKNISIFVTCAKREQEAIATRDYAYTVDQVKLTGFPRHDKLIYDKDKPKNVISLMPTWRKALVAEYDSVTGLRDENPEFDQSEYFRFFNGIINDERILDALDKIDGSIRFALHPCLSQEAKKFKSSSSRVQVLESCVYSDEFEKAAMMITDYSSVAFDFSMLQRPLVYTQFDYEDLYKGQTYDKGYFSYSEDGFGPVCYDYETTIKTILEIVNNNFQMEEKYRQRVDSFFFQPTKKRCELVVSALQ